MGYLKVVAKGLSTDRESKYRTKSENILKSSEPHRKNVLGPLVSVGQLPAVA